MNKHNKMEMAWNEPGGNGDDPWGGGSGGKRKSQQATPDVDEMINKIKEKFGSGNVHGPGKGMMGIILVVILLVWLFTGIYIVEPAERGVEFRFGEYTSTSGPGPHWHIPYPIEAVEIVNVDRIQKKEIGYRSEGRSGRVQSESLMLTKDENIIDITFAVQYVIKDAKDYLINLVQPDVTLHEVTQSAVREIIGKSKMDFVLTEGREEIVDRAKVLIQQILDSYKSGLEISSVNMQDAQPPDQVQDSFDDVVKSREDKQRLINESEAYRNSVLPVARGKAARITAEANGYREQVVSKAEGETSRFLQILTEYEKAPEVTRKRLFLETMEQVLGKSGKLIMDSKNSSLLMLPLEKMMKNNQITTPNLSGGSESMAPEVKQNYDQTIRTGRQGLREGR